MYTIKTISDNSKINFPNLDDCFYYGRDLLDYGKNFEIFYNSNKINISILNYWIKLEEKITLENYYAFDEIISDYDYSRYDNLDDDYFKDFYEDFSEDIYEIEITSDDFQDFCCY